MPYKVEYEYVEPKTLKRKVTRGKQEHRKTALKNAYEWLYGLGTYDRMINGVVYLRKAKDNTPAGYLFAKKRGNRIHIVYLRNDLYYIVAQDGSVRKVE